jgi:hypothetical protein
MTTKTLGQLWYEQQVADGMTNEEIELYNRTLHRISTLKADFQMGFLRDCERDNVKPTIYRYKKYIKAQEDELADFRKNFKKYREEDKNASN